MNKRPDGYSVDIAYNVEDDEERSMPVVTTIGVGHRFMQATQTYEVIMGVNLMRKGITYIRLVLKQDDREMVLTRRTPSGAGDW